MCGVVPADICLSKLVLAHMFLRHVLKSSLRGLQLLRCKICSSMASALIPT